MAQEKTAAGAARGAENTPSGAKRAGESAAPGTLMTQSTRKRAKAMSAAANGPAPAGAPPPGDDAEEALPRVLEARFVEEVRAPRRGGRRPARRWARASSSRTLELPVCAPAHGRCR